MTQDTRDCYGFLFQFVGIPSLILVGALAMTLQAAPQRPLKVSADDPPERVGGVYAFSAAPVLTVDEPDGRGQTVRTTYYLVFRSKAQEARMTAGLRVDQPLVVLGYRGVNGPWHHLVVVDLEEP